MARKISKSLVPRRPSTAQLRDAEYTNEIRHLASSELQYRMSDNSSKAERSRLDLAELDAKRKTLLHDVTRLDRERAVLHDVFASRLRPVSA